MLGIIRSIESSSGSKKPYPKTHTFATIEIKNFNDEGSSIYRCLFRKNDSVKEDSMIRFKPIPVKLLHKGTKIVFIELVNIDVLSPDELLLAEEDDELIIFQTAINQIIKPFYSSYGDLILTLTVSPNKLSTENIPITLKNDVAVKAMKSISVNKKITVCGYFKQSRKSNDFIDLNVLDLY